MNLRKFLAEKASVKSELRNLFNKDLVFTGLNQIWLLIAGPVLLLLIPFILSVESQGYYYTMSSLIGLIIFADLGFSTIVLQFSAHEFAHLTFDAKNNIIGEDNYIKRLASLFRFSIKWVLFIVAVGYPLIFGFGFSILSTKSYNVDWIFAWGIFVFFSACDFIINPILNFLEGCNSVANIQKLRMLTSIVYSIFLILFLILHLDLMSIGYALFIKVLFGIVLIVKKYGLGLKTLFKASIENYYNWKPEIFKLLGKYAISFASGYLIFQIYTPLAFTYYGAAEAGKLGLSIVLWNSIYCISTVWIASIIPKLNITISLKKWEELDKLFFKNLKLTILTYLGGCFIFFLAFGLFSNSWWIFNRFSDLQTLILLSVSYFFQAIINAIAFYLRGHREEPLVIPSFLSGIYCLITTIFISINFPISFIMLGFFSAYLWGFAWTLYIFQKKRTLWHKLPLNDLKKGPL